MILITQVGEDFEGKHKFHLLVSREHFLLQNHSTRKYCAALVLPFTGSDNSSHFHQGTLLHKVQISNTGCQELPGRLQQQSFV